MPMIAHIEGTIIHKTDKWIVVDVNGVGYKLYVTLDTSVSIKDGEN